MLVQYIVSGYVFCLRMDFRTHLGYSLDAAVDFWFDFGLRLVVVVDVAIARLSWCYLVD